MKMLRFALAFACLALPSLAGAQVQLSVRAIDASSLPGKHTWTPNPSLRAFKADQDKRLTSYAYRPILRFAECASRFDKDVAERVLGSPLQSFQAGDALQFVAKANRGCVLEESLVHPLLLRAAFAETRLKDSGHAAALSGQTAVGLPAVVDGYPLRRIADCQVRRAPALVRGLLSTQPGDPAEHQAARILFETTAECGTARLGRLTPTAARLALVEAEYVRRFVARQ